MLWFVQHFKEAQHNDTAYIIKPQSAILGQVYRTELHFSQFLATKDIQLTRIPLIFAIETSKEG
jgi:hypothetical protein